MNDEGATPVCRGANVNPDWWIEPDAFPEDFPEGKRDQIGSYGLDTGFGRLQQETRINQTRAQILCYGCPLLWACRERSWDEPAHVFGGLTATERYQARTEGQVRPYGTYRSGQNGLLRRHIEVAFLGGCKPDEIAATLNLSVKTVMYQIRNILMHAREQAERGQEWLPIPPKFSGPISRKGYRLGLASSQSSLAESA